MGFFKKLFRRKNAPVDVAPKPGRKSGRRGRTKPLNKEDDRGSPTNTASDEPPVTNNFIHIERQSEEELAAKARRGPDLSDGSQRVVLKQRNVASPEPVELKEYTGPVDLDDFDQFALETDENEKEAPPPRLNSQRLAEFTEQQTPTSGIDMSQSGPIFTMDPEPVKARQQLQETSQKLFQAGHVPVGSESDGESSSFNLSTDAEDTEYEDLKKHGIVRKYKTPKGTLNASMEGGLGGPQMGSPTNYNTDGEGSIFPNLQTDDEGTISESVLSGPPMQLPTEADSLQIVSLQKLSSNDTGNIGADDPRAWGFPTDPVTSPTNNSSASGRRDFTSPKSAASASSPSNVFKDAFSNFADFTNFGGENFFQVGEASSRNGVDNSAGAMQLNQGYSKPEVAASSSSPAITSDTSLSELLAQAKSKKSSSRKSGGSVNSAPAVSAPYLKQQHGTKARGERFSDSRSQHDGTSVSDIIKSLEADNASRSRRSSRKQNDGHSSHSRDGHSVRSAKERFRRRRENERRRGNDDSTDSDEDNDAESWLIDEVTGALGPRGIAADLESLSGRSNRSRSSGGGRSHKSHRSHRSHKSHRSSRGRRSKVSSDASVDSHGSKRSHGSRRSRSSRYSHRSAKSYISQMSEQSRSVANDLLRLEMQLAMVNPNGSNVETGSGASVASRGVRSRSGKSSGRSTASPRRSRVSVVAPAGKLGIILANKADSRGTVVSGVRTSSVLADRISPGDRIVAIDGEDVSLMTVSEITTIMARKSEYERTLTILTTPKNLGSPDSATSPRDYRYRN